uniref:Uncharacterized protein n=1 Tax=Caenorhabditis tropicalis TaxID=1561998 RepID=A0A1I7UHA4_9PELO
MKLSLVLLALVAFIVVVDARKHFLQDAVKRTTRSAPLPSKAPGQVLGDVKDVVKRTTRSAPLPSKAPGAQKDIPQQKRVTLADGATPVPPSSNMFSEMGKLMADFLKKLFAAGKSSFADDKA